MVVFCQRALHLARPLDTEYAGGVRSSSQDAALDHIERCQLPQQCYRNRRRAGLCVPAARGRTAVLTVGRRSSSEDL